MMNSSSSSSTPPPSTPPSTITHQHILNSNNNTTSAAINNSQLSSPTPFNGQMYPQQQQQLYSTSSAIYQLLQQQQQLNDFNNINSAVVNNHHNLSSLMQNLQFVGLNHHHPTLNNYIDHNNTYNNTNNNSNTNVNNNAFDFYPNYSNHHHHHLNTPSPINSTTSPNSLNNGGQSGSAGGSGLTPDQLTQLMNTVTLQQQQQQGGVLSSSPPSSNNSSSSPSIMGGGGGGYNVVNSSHSVINGGGGNSMMLPPSSHPTRINNNNNNTTNPILLLSSGNNNLPFGTGDDNDDHNTSSTASAIGGSNSNGGLGCNGGNNRYLLAPPPPNVFSSFFSSSACSMMNAYPPIAVSKATLNGKINQQRAGFPVCYNVQTAKVTLKLFINQQNQPNNQNSSLFQMTQNRMYQCNEIEKLIPKLNPNEIAIFGFVVFCENSSKKREVLTHLETFYSQSVNPQDYSAQIAIGTYGRKCSADLVKHCGFIIAYRMNKESFMKQSSNGAGNGNGSFFNDETAAFDKAFVQEVRFGFRKKAGREKLPLIREPVICDVSKPIEYHDFLNNQSILKLDDLLHSHYQPITRFCTSVQEAADAIVVSGQSASGNSLMMDVMKDIKNNFTNNNSSSGGGNTIVNANHVGGGHQIMMDDTISQSDMLSEKAKESPLSGNSGGNDQQQPIFPKIEEEDGFDLLKFNESIVKNLSKSSLERWLNYEPIVNEHPSYLAVLLGLIYSRGYFSIVESKSNIPINIDTLEALMNLAFDGTPVTVGTLVGNVQINLKEVFLTNDINYILYYLEVKELVPCFMAGVYLYCLLYYTKNDLEKHRMEPYVSNMRKNFTAVTQDFYFEDYKVLDIGDSLLSDNSPEFMNLAFKKLKNYVIKIGKYYNKLLVEQAIVQNSTQNNYEFNKQERLESAIDGFSNYLLNRGSIHEKKRSRDDLAISSSFTENDFIVKPRRTFALQKYEDQKMVVIEQDKKLMLLKSFVDSNTTYENNDVLQVLCDLEERRLELEKEFAEKLRILAEKEKYALQ